jgi:hypothetical protein
MVRQLRPGCSIPTDCSETHILASVLRVTTNAAGSGRLNCHGREPVPLSCAPQPATCTSFLGNQQVSWGRTAAATYGIVCTQLLQQARVSSYLDVPVYLPALSS